MGFDEFFDAHHDEVVRALTLAVGDRARAEDATQEAFAKAYRRWPAVAAMDRPVGWVIVVGTNQLRRWIARTERRFVVVADPVPAGRPTGGDVAATTADATDLAAALDRLPPRQRATVVLRYLCDLPTAEVARALGCAEGTVKSALHAALAALRVDLDPDDRGRAGTERPAPATTEEAMRDANR